MAYWTHPWPTWADGEPVDIGETAMSLSGPLRIDAVVIGDGGWTLLSNQSMYSGAAKMVYIIDQGDWGESPTRQGEPCDFWQEGDSTFPQYVFAPFKLCGEV